MGRAYKNPKTELTQKQEGFAQDVASGMSQRQAALKNYDFKEGISNEVVDPYASVLMANPKIKARVAELQKQAEEGAILDRKARQAMLTNFAMDETVSNSDRLSALDKLNKMSGDYSETIRQEISGQIDVKEERHTVIENLLKECGIK